MNIRGWVYIFTNESMPGLVKVGFTLKDPTLRAKELGGAGLPHPYIVEFEAFVTNPREVEQKTHRALRNVHENKEWFRCSIAHAVSSIRVAAGSDAIFENIRNGMQTERAVPVSEEPKPAEYAPEPRSAPKPEFARTATHVAPCRRCGARFSVTITPYDSGARCPRCSNLNDISEFQHREFGLASAVGAK
jgi:hypothetical protein